MPPVIIKQNGATQLQSNKYRRNIEQDGKGANFRTWTRQPPRCWLYISVFQYQSEAVSSYNNLQSFSYIISHVLQSSNLLNATCDFIKIFQQRQRYKVKYFSHYYEKIIAQQLCTHQMRTQYNLYQILQVLRNIQLNSDDLWTIAIFDFFSCTRTIAVSSASKILIRVFVRATYVTYILIQIFHGTQVEGRHCCCAIRTQPHATGYYQIERRDITVKQQISQKYRIGWERCQLQNVDTSAATLLALYFCVLIPIRSSIQLQQSVIVQLYNKSRVTIIQLIKRHL
ncbi:Hypothetical_protein [Hexamita inflata]|uniref:Hypothetical_protein n=1 Tax=Hexamita inflata TaxID=28002 RepID=A0ABP1I722_9EUKA